MAEVRKKCEKCRGKGAVVVGKHGGDKWWLTCTLCLGRGEWWTNNRPKKPKGKR